MAADRERAQKEKTDNELRILERMRLDDSRRNERINHLKQLEQTLHIALQNQEQQRKIDLDRLETEFQQRSKQAEYDYHSRLQDEAISNMEQKATQRIMELMSLREKEDRTRQLRNQIDQRKKEEEEKDRLTSEKWKLEDEERRIQQELLLRER